MLEVMGSGFYLLNLCLNNCSNIVNVKFVIAAQITTDKNSCLTVEKNSVHVNGIIKYNFQWL